MHSKKRPSTGSAYSGEAVTWFMKVYPKTKRADWPPEYKPVSVLFKRRKSCCGVQIECVQRAGEVIFVPYGWWHVVINMDTTVAVTQNYCSSANLAAVWTQVCDKRPDFARYWIEQLKVSSSLLRLSTRHFMLL
jgi:histone arginine demethylase JMJD6